MPLPPLRNHPVTIASGQSLSPAAQVGEKEIVGVIIPSSWTAANLTFQGSIDDGATFNNVFDSAGTELTITVGASRYIVFTESLLTAFKGIRNLKVRSGTSGVPVNQASAATVQLLVR
jgi:hypothetical protein